jgi:NTE family protein
VKLIALVGAVQALEHLDLLSGVKNYIGSSAGALVAVMLALGYTGAELQALVLRTDFDSFRDDSFGLIRDSTRLLFKYGYCKGQALSDFLKKVVHAKSGDEDLTLAQMAALTKREVFITTVCLEEKKTHYLSSKTHPGLPVALALRMSMSIPVFYTPVLYDGKHYVDGGLTNNYPLHYFDGKLPNPKTMGLRIMDPGERCTRDMNSADTEIHSLPEFLWSVFTNMSYQLERITTSPEDWNRTIRVTTDLGMLDTQVTPLQMLSVIAQTYQETLDQVVVAPLPKKINTK